MDVITVRRCIACGAIDTPQPCLGPCVDRRLDLVGAETHEQALARLAAAEAALASLRSLAASLASDAWTWASLREPARRALREAQAAPEAVAGDVITTWACDFCGRIEAPQECLGVCIRPELRMVAAAEHEAVLERDAAARAELAPLQRLARWVAWSSPRSGHAGAGAEAVRAAARELLGRDA